MRRLLTTVTSIGLLALVQTGTAGQVTNLGKAHMVKRTETKLIPRGVQYVFNRDLPQGRTKKKSDGQDGVTQVTVHELKIGNKVVASKKLSKTLKPTSPAVIEMSRSGFRTSRGAFSRSTVMTVTATAYQPHDGSTTGHTATGRKAEYGVIAVDPRVIPLNSLVYVEGYGFAVAADTGGAIKGNKIDVCFPSASQVNTWGRKKVTIHVFKEKISKKE